MPVLEWMGKDKVVTHHRDVPYRVLERVAEKGMTDSHGSDCGNMIIHGDNLEALKSLLPEYEGRVDCIYIDPPYNTGNEGWVYNDNVKDPRIMKWIGEVVGPEGQDFSRHDKWLCMMYPRLQLMRKLLSDRGAIFISIGDDESSRLKLICDEIFGAQCFKGDIIWQRTYSPRNDAKNIFPVEAEHILCYSRNASWMAAKLDRDEGMDGRYSSVDGDARLWSSGDAAAPGAETHHGMVYAIQHPITGKLLYPANGRCWTFGQDQMLQIMNEWADYELRRIDDADKRAEICGCEADSMEKDIKAIMLVSDSDSTHVSAMHRYKQGNWPRLFFTSNGIGGIRCKRYLDEADGRLATNLWPYSEVGHTDEGSKELKSIFGGSAVFQNPKPSRLIRRILRIAATSDSIVLDAFAGSGTTGQAVLQENRSAGRNMRFILVEMGDYADSITSERVRRTIAGYGTDKTRRDRLYEKKITASNMKNFDKYRREAVEVKDSVAPGVYSKIEGPKMDGSSIVVDGVTVTGETVPGVDSGFSYYELGPVLFDSDGTLNESVPRDSLYRYVWYTETRLPYIDMTGTNRYLLGSAGGIVYYLAYEPGEETVLDWNLLSSLPTRDRTTVIYADRCVIDQETLERLGITFKQVPRQIARF